MIADCPECASAAVERTARLLNERTASLDVGHPFEGYVKIEDVWEALRGYPDDAEVEA